MTTNSNERTHFVAGLRAIADLIEDNPDANPHFLTDPPNFSIFPTDREETLWWVDALQLTDTTVRFQHSPFSTRIHGKVNGCIPVTLFLRDATALKERQPASMVQDWVYDAATATVTA